MSEDLLSKKRSRVVNICSMVSCAVAITALAGWSWNMPLLEEDLPGFSAMYVSTAVAVGLAAAALYLASRARVSRGFGILQMVISGVMLAGACVELFGYVFRATSSVASVILTTAIRDLRYEQTSMSPQSALVVLMLSLSISFASRRQAVARIGESLTVVALTITFAALLGHIYGARLLDGTTAFGSMSVNAAVCFALLEIGCLAANPHSRIISLITSHTLGGMAARRLIPIAIIVPTIIGWLRIVGQNNELYNTGVGAALTILTSVVLTCGAIYIFSRLLHRVDADRKAAETQIAESERRYRNLVDHGQGLICTHDLDGILLTVNPAALRALGYEAGEMIGKRISDFMPQDLRPQFDAYLRQVTNEGLAEGLLHLPAKNGRLFIWRFHNVLVYEADSDAYVLGHAHDVTELLAAQMALKNLSLTDDLTGLYNRRGFMTLADQQLRLEGHSGTARGLNVLFADLDGLKKINDTYGHERGSAAICEFADILKSIFRSADVVARWGGDEFVILTIGSRNDNAELLTARIRDRLHKRNLESEMPYVLDCSIGVAPVGEAGVVSIEEAIADADRAMYRDKRSRKLTRPEYIDPGRLGSGEWPSTRPDM